MTKLFSKRFEELLQQCDDIEKTKRREQSGISGELRDQIDADLFLGWRVKAKSHLERVCGLESQHFKAFEEAEASSWSTSYERFKKAKTVFLAAQEDFEGGYLTSLRELVQAEVFDSELEQASELLRAGYKTAGAVIAGVVLETTLRDLCIKNKIPSGKLDKMNADLAKTGEYNLLVQKQISAWAQVRNDAAHGNNDKFDDKDVSSMIEDVRRFVTEHISA
ncbi:MAG: hypothetical protein ACLP7O_17230 [Terracidiphilus sp.]